MRILTVVEDLAVRGMQRAAQTFSLAYRQEGHEVAILAYAGDGPRRSRLEQASIRVISEPRDVGSSIKAAARFEPDLIQIHRDGAYKAVHADILRRLRGNGRAVVLETSSFARVDYSDEADLIDVHMPKSLFSLWFWRRCLGHRRSRQIGVMVPNPVETGRFPRAARTEALEQRRIWGVPEEAYLCGHIGYKCSPLVLRGFARVAAQDRSMWLVWVDPPADLAGWIGTLPDAVRGRVITVPGADDDAKLARIYSAFDCLLHASPIGETFGYVLAEALLCGVPIVSLARPPRDNGHLEVIGHGDGGLVAGQPRYFAEAVRQMRRDEEFRRQVVRRGPERICARYDVDSVAALALRVGELAREHRNREDLRAALEAEPGFRTRVDDDEIMALVRNTLGGPRIRDLALMRLVTSAGGQRLVRILKHREAAAMPLWLGFPNRFEAKSG